MEECSKNLEVFFGLKTTSGPYMPSMRSLTKDVPFILAKS